GVYRNGILKGVGPGEHKHLLLIRRVHRHFSPPPVSIAFDFELGAPFPRMHEIELRIKTARLAPTRHIHTYRNVGSFGIIHDMSDITHIEFGLPALQLLLSVITQG